jgi:glutamyl-tRNA reductase
MAAFLHYIGGIKSMAAGGERVMAERDQVGFIGLGAMGARMAANVLAAGYPLTVYNRDKEKTRGIAAYIDDVSG